MPVYCISYDLIKDKDYSGLIEKLKEYNHIHALKSTWFIATEDGASKIRENLRQSMDEDDDIVVIQVVKDWATYVEDEVSDWMQKNL